MIAKLIVYSISAYSLLLTVICCYLMAKRKNAAAVALGRKGGLAKVKKGTAMLTKAERIERARTAAKARWGKKPD